MNPLINESNKIYFQPLCSFNFDIKIIEQNLKNSIIRDIKTKADVDVENLFKQAVSKYENEGSVLIINKYQLCKEDIIDIKESFDFCKKIFNHDCSKGGPFFEICKGL